MRPANEGRALARPPREDAASTPRPQRHLSPADRRHVQSRLDLDQQSEKVLSSRRDHDDVRIPNHPLAPAEASMRFFVNQINRERRHWWIRELERHQAENPSCTCWSWCRWRWSA
jgi:hypothetical protein